MEPKITVTNPFDRDFSTCRNSAGTDSDISQTITLFNKCADRGIWINDRVPFMLSD